MGITWAYNMSNGILLLSDGALKLLQIKHPKAKIAKAKTLLQVQKKLIHLVFFFI